MRDFTVETQRNLAEWKAAALKVLQAQNTEFSERYDRTLGSIKLEQAQAREDNARWRSQEAITLNTRLRGIETRFRASSTPFDDLSLDEEQLVFAPDYGDSPPRGTMGANLQVFADAATAFQRASNLAC